MKSNCNKCIHSKMCKYNGITSDELLKDLKDKYDFIEDVEFTCKYFEKPVDKISESKKVADKPAENVRSVKQTIITDADILADKSKKRKTASKEDNDFNSISVFTMGFDGATEKEFIKLGINTMKDVYAMSYKISDESRIKINAKLEVFNQKKI